MTLFFISVRVILHPGATLATGSSFHNRKVGRTNPVGHAGSKSEPTNANNLVSVDFLPSISRPFWLQQSPIDPWCGWSAARVAKFRFSKAVAPAPTGEGRTSTFSRLRQRIGSRSPVANMFSVRCLCAAARLVRSPFVFWFCPSLPAPWPWSDLVVRRLAASPPLQPAAPLVWSRDQDSRHVTTHRAARQLHKVSFYISTTDDWQFNVVCHVHFQWKIKANCCYDKLHLQFGSKSETIFHVGPDAALQLGWGAMWRMRRPVFQFWYAIPPLLPRHLLPRHQTDTQQSVSDRGGESLEVGWVQVASNLFQQLPSLVLASAGQKPALQVTQLQQADHQRLRKVKCGLQGAAGGRLRASWLLSGKTSLWPDCEKEKSDSCGLWGMSTEFTGPHYLEPLGIDFQVTKAKTIANLAPLLKTMWVSLRWDLRFWKSWTCWSSMVDEF